MFLAVFKLGEILSYGQPVYFWVELSVLCFSIGAAVWLILAIRKHVHPPTSTEQKDPIVPLGPLLTRSMRRGKPIGKVLMWVALGWFSHQLYTHLIYTPQLKEWKMMKTDYQRNYAAWLARQPEGRLDDDRR